jgi:hypothetical protein
VKCPECCNDFIVGDPARVGISPLAPPKVKTGDSAQGNQKIKPAGDSAQGNQKIKPTGGSGQGTQKKPPPPPAHDPKATAAGRKTGGRLQVQARQRGRMLGILFAPLFWLLRAIFTRGGAGRKRRTIDSLILPAFWLLVLCGVCVGGWFTWTHIIQPNLTPEDQAKVGTTGKTGKTTEKKKWVPEEVFDVSKGPAKIGGIHIKVMRVEVGVPTGRDVKDDENRFLLKIQIENKGDARIEYKGWSYPDPAGEAEEPVLIDSADIKYRRVTFGVGTLAEGQVIAETIHPGKWINDLVVFEAPPDKVLFAKIELPAANIGAEGKLRLRIPREMWGKIPPKPVKEPLAEQEPAEVKMYREQLKSKLLKERREAILKLGELGPMAASAAADLATVMLKDTSETVRTAAAESIGKIGVKAKAVIPQLIEALKKDEFFMVKAAAAESLGQMGAAAKEALPALKEALNSKEEKVPAAAKEAIMRIDPQAIP